MDQHNTCHGHLHRCGPQSVFRLTPVEASVRWVEIVDYTRGSDLYSPPGFTLLIYIIRSIPFQGPFSVRRIGYYTSECDILIAKEM